MPPQITFKDPGLQAIHEQLCRTYREILGRDFEEDYAAHQRKIMAQEHQA
jgi:hypothetical protein